MAKLIDITPWRKVWHLFDARERRNALKVLAVAVTAAAASTAMVGSIMPFLSVLADPSAIQRIPQLDWAYQRLEFSSSYWFLVVLGAASLVVILGAMLIQLLSVYAIARFAMMRVHSFSSRLVASYLGQPYEFFLNRHSGEMGTRVLAEAQEVVNRFLTPAAELITALLTILALLGFLFWIQPLITLAAIIVLGGTYGITYGASRMRLKRLGQQRAAMNAERYRTVTEAFGGVKDIKLLGREAAYVDRYNVPSLRVAGAEVQVRIMSDMPYYIIQTVALAGVVTLCLLLLDPAAFGGGSALQSILPLLGVFAFAGQRLMPELGRVYRAAAKIQFARAAIDTIYDDLMASQGKPALSRTVPMGLGLNRELRLDGLSYRYPNTELAGVTEISLAVAAGEKIGIVGGTGAGKTTLADLILGLLQPHAGQIVTDGIVVTETNIRAWQQTVGYVPQAIFLTDASVAENIALGVPADQVDMDRVTHAARIAQIDTFVREELPEGYQTFVGERGVRLSGGQRQRIGIARALYHDADLVVFDEATSALDNLTETEVMGAIDALPGDKTVLMIAHRLSTVKRCDRIIVMDKGRIVGCDSWDALMAGNPTFQRIARLGEAA